MNPEYLHLIKLDEPRVFLKEALKILYKKSGRINYADFSRKCQFSSRSFISEYIRGKKNLSPESLRKVAKSLKLPRKFSQLFKYLVQREGGLDKTKIENQGLIQKKIESIRTQINFEYQTVLQKKQKNIIQKISAFLVYASLGNQQSGATIEDISKKSKLNQIEISRVLLEFQKQRVVEKRGQKYFAISEKLDFLNIDEDQGLGNLVQEVCNNLSRKRKSIIKNKENFVFFTSLSVNSWNMGKMKKELKEATFEILDKYQSDECNTIAQIFMVSHS